MLASIVCVLSTRRAMHSRRGTRLAEAVRMQRQLPTRIISAESGPPCFSLVAPSNGPTLVIAQTPGEQEEAFGRRVADRVTALATADISDIVLVSRKRAELRARKHATGWSLAALA